MILALKRMFSKETDIYVDKIIKDASKQIRSTAKVAKKQRDLLQKDGITMQIYVATGGARRD